MSGIVRRGADGSISWHGDQQVVLGPITLEINGLRMTVDVSSLENVLDLAVADAGVLRSVAAAFANPSVVEPILAADHGAVVEGPTLGPAALRLATTFAVDAVHLGDLDESVLVLDAGYARAAAGDPDARREYSIASAVPDRLVDEIETADYTGPLVERLLEAIVAAPGSAFSLQERTRLIGSLRDRATRAITPWELTLPENALVTLALDLGGSGAAVAEYLADLRALPPRLLVFTGPDDSDVTTVAKGSGRVEVSARVRPDAFAEQAIEDGLFAVAAVPDSGDLLAFAPAVVVDGELRATIVLPDDDGQTLRFAFVRSGIDLDTFRLDHLGEAMTRIDRFCRHAWTQHRVAGAVRAAVGIDDSGVELDRKAELADDKHREAVDAIDTAQSLLTRLLRRNRNDPRRDALERYGDGLEQLSRMISEPPQIDGPSGPTLAELHSVTLR